MYKCHLLKYSLNSNVTIDQATIDFQKNRSCNCGNTIHSHSRVNQPSGYSSKRSSDASPGWASISRIFPSWVDHWVSSSSLMMIDIRCSYVVILALRLCCQSRRSFFCATEYVLLSD